MTMMGPNTAIRPGAIAARAWALIVDPGAAWRTIAEEPPNLRDLFLGYVAPLAAIPALCGLIGGLAFGGANVNGVLIRPAPGQALVNAALLFASTLAAIYLVGLIIDLLAETFSARRNRDQAMKLSAYSATPLLLAGVFGLYPPIGLLSVLGLYAAFVLYRGLPILMGAAPEKALGYAAATVVSGVVLVVVLAALSSCVSGVGRV